MATPAIPAEPSSLVITVSADLALRQQRGAHTPALAPCDGLVMGWAIASVVAPPGRQPRSAAALVRLRHSGFASLPAYRVGAGALALPAALLAALARLARPAPSPLALAKERAAGPGPTSYGLGWRPGAQASGARPGEGTDQQEGARQAATRLMAKRRQAQPPLQGRVPAGRLWGAGSPQRAPAGARSARHPGGQSRGARRAAPARRGLAEGAPPAPQG